MSRVETLNEALLHTCPEDQVFWVYQGPQIRSLSDLVFVLRRMKDYTFVYHVNEDNNKNDFADWIRYSLKDEELAFRLEAVHDKEEYIKVILQRLDELTYH